MHKVTLALPLSLLANRGGAARGPLSTGKTRVVAYNVTPDLGKKRTPLKRVTLHRPLEKSLDSFAPAWEP